MNMKRKRIKFKSDKDIDIFAGYVNKCDNLKKINLTIDSIEKLIDRVQISVRDKKGYFDYIYDVFKSKFKYQHTKREKKKKLIYTFFYNDSEIQLGQYYQKKSKYGWITISIQDPDIDNQQVIWDILAPIRLQDKKAVSISQVECALDFHPARIENLLPLYQHMAQSVSLKYSRAGSVNNFYPTTFYIGKDGNVRNGSKGVTVYLKEELGCVRVELRANRAFLNRYGPSSLPIVPGDFKLRDYIECRQSFDNDSLGKLIKVVVKRKRYPSNKFNKYALKDALTCDLQRKICGEILSDFELLDDYEKVPLAKQMDIYRELKAKYGLTHQPGYFFPIQH